MNKSVQDKKNAKTPEFRAQRQENSPRRCISLSLRQKQPEKWLSLVGVLKEEYWEPIRTALNVVLGFGV
jgi:hypothetical protein